MRLHTFRGEFPKWKFQVQIMPESEAETYHINPFNVSKVWPYAEYPLIDIGVIELNRNPENYHAEIEQAAFEPSSIIPGIGFSPDKMVQARIMAHAKADRYRIGVNFAAQPVNHPHSKVNIYHRDDKMCFDDSFGGAVNYEPNSLSEPVEDKKFLEPPLKISGDADRYDLREDTDYFTRPGAVWPVNWT